MIRRAVARFEVDLAALICFLTVLTLLLLAQAANAAEAATVAAAAAPPAPASTPAWLAFLLQCLPVIIAVVLLPLIVMLGKKLNDWLTAVRDGAGADTKVKLLASGGLLLAHLAESVVAEFGSKIGADMIDPTTGKLKADAAAKLKADAVQAVKDGLGASATEITGVAPGLLTTIVGGAVEKAVASQKPATASPQ